jgi:hypothetical protein
VTSVLGRLSGMPLTKFHVQIAGLAVGLIDQKAHWEHLGQGIALWQVRCRKLVPRLRVLILTGTCRRNQCRRRPRTAAIVTDGLSCWCELPGGRHARALNASASACSAWTRASSCSRFFRSCCTDPGPAWTGTPFSATSGPSSSCRSQEWACTQCSSQSSTNTSCRTPGPGRRRFCMAASSLQQTLSQWCAQPPWHACDRSPRDDVPRAAAQANSAVLRRGQTAQAHCARSGTCTWAGGCPGRRRMWPT